MKTKLLISFVVIGKNEGLYLNETLTRCQKISKNVVYVDSGSTDNSIDIAKKNNVKIIKSKPPYSASKARNLGFEYTNSDYVCFVDADVHIAPMFFSKIDEYLSTNSVIFGWKKDLTSNGISFAAPKKYLKNPDYLGGNFIISSTLFKKVDGFNTSLLAEEERDLLIRCYNNGADAHQINYCFGVHNNFKKKSRTFCEKYFSNRSFAMVKLYNRYIFSSKKTFYLLRFYTLSLLSLISALLFTYFSFYFLLQYFFVTFYIYTRTNQLGRSLFPVHYIFWLVNDKYK